MQPKMRDGGGVEIPIPSYVFPEASVTVSCVPSDRLMHSRPAQIVGACW